MEECYTNRRPNRSDVHSTIEEEAKLQEETRHYFDAVAPERHTKPQRSEYSSQYVDEYSSQRVDALSFTDGNSHRQASIPEFLEFQRLEAHSDQKLSYNGKGEAEEEFVETEYYNDLNGSDKHHHTTGTGFIKMENANGNCFTLAPDSATCRHASCKGNPATNEWIPAPADTVTFGSDKPKRSDN